jgi:hypothetical protein
MLSWPLAVFWRNPQEDWGRFVVDVRACYGVNAVLRFSLSPKADV